AQSAAPAPAAVSVAGRLHDAVHFADGNAEGPVDGVRRLVGVDHDLELASREKTLRDAGHKLPDSSGHDQ
ncbi:MAG: hypothetical protein QF351_06800, partial [Phycisphaerales bacterium]|nr:hypothetical protein [Phycisphaerales bacterium]